MLKKKAIIKTLRKRGLYGMQGNVFHSQALSESCGRRLTNPMGRAKRCLLLGLIVPVDEAEEVEEADEESSSCSDSGSG